MAGIGGAYLSLVQTPFWVERMTAGRGWIALALVVFAAWRPTRVLVGAYLFGGITHPATARARGSGCDRRADPLDAAVSGDDPGARDHLARRVASAPGCAGLARQGFSRTSVTAVTSQMPLEEIKHRRAHGRRFGMASVGADVHVQMSACADGV